MLSFNSLIDSVVSLNIISGRAWILWLFDSQSKTKGGEFKPMRDKNHAKVFVVVDT